MTPEEFYDKLVVFRCSRSEMEWGRVARELIDTYKKLYDKQLKKRIHIGKERKKVKIGRKA